MDRVPLDAVHWGLSQLSSDWESAANVSYRQSLACWGSHSGGPSAFWAGVNWETPVAAGQSAGQPWLSTCEPEWEAPVRTLGTQQQLLVCSSVLSVTALCRCRLRELRLGKQQEKHCYLFSSCVPCLLPPEMNVKWKGLLCLTSVLPFLLYREVFLKLSMLLLDSNSLWMKSWKHMKELMLLLNSSSSLAQNCPFVPSFCSEPWSTIALYTLAFYAETNTSR